MDKVKRVKYQLGDKMGKEIIMQYQYSHCFPWQGRILLTLLIVVFIFNPLASAVAAEEKPDAQSGWEFQVAPYLWAISMNGDATVKGQEADVDVSFSDIWDELNFAFMMQY